ncbi:hypothetical protein D3C85_1353790 [compost metagenome]
MHDGCGFDWQLGWTGYRPLAVFGAVDIQLQHVVVDIEQLRHLADQFVLDAADGKAVGLNIKRGEDVVKERLEIDGQRFAARMLFPGELAGFAQHCQAFDLMPAQAVVQHVGNGRQ